MENTTSVAAPQDKWADRIRLFSGSPAQAAEWKTEEAYALPDPLHVRDLPQTEIEIAAIGEVTAVLNDLIKIMCGLGPFIFSADRVHILDAAEFQAKVGRGRFSGRSRLGHVYLERDQSTANFMGLLAHEMFHAVSYLWLDLWEAGAVSADGTKWPRVTIRRSGMTLIDPSYGTWLPHFHGLNEMVTELTAVIVRQLLAPKSFLLDAAGRKQLGSLVCSPPLVAFANRLVGTVAGPGNDHAPAARTLISDCLLGTDVFLGLLEAKLPGATDILRCTGARPDELRTAAERLGFADLAAFSDCFRHK
ncbi:MAG: hypothetical protein WCT10_04630 [Patescibacteria group bacterium]|jgi:hypothetical protein